MADTATTTEAAKPAATPSLLAAPEPVKETPSSTSQGTPGEVAKTDEPHDDDKTPSDPYSKTKFEDGSSLSEDGEQKQDETKTEEGEPEKAKASDAAADIVLTLPEGVPADDEMVQSFKTTAKELGLTSESAQKVMDVYLAHAKKEAQATTEFFEKQREEWQAAVRADKDIGGPALKQNLVLAQRTLSKFATPELRQLLEDTGLGNNPHLIKMFVKQGRAIADDKFDGAGVQDARSQQDKLMDALYPNTTFEK